MKTLATVIVLLTALESFAQSASGTHKFYSIGITAGHYGYDPGIGVELGLPGFYNNRFCVRIKGNINWLEQYKADLDHWIQYQTTAISFIYNAYSTERIRIYVDLGTFAIFPDRRFSDERILKGIDGSMGIEIFLANKQTSNVTYYINGGVEYVEAYAEKLESRPRYGSGAIAVTGFRYYIRRFKD